MHSRIAAFVSRRWGVPEGLVQVDVWPFPGGLESAVSLARVTADRPQAAIPERLVVKELRPGLEREADIYALLWRHLEQPPAVRVFGSDTADERTWLYLEEARPCSAWPWSDTSLAASVCVELARFHDRADLPRRPFSWSYEAELAWSAEATLRLAASARDRSGRRCWRRLGDLRRVVAALPALRGRLRSGGTSVIHGDVHPGNAIVAGGGPSPRVVLIDWARARLGSPLEDLASWLHSLGCWEPRARQRHDTLMRAYLEARSTRPALAARLRTDYYLASISNGLSGAIRYHLAVLGDRSSSEGARSASRQALVAWERVARRAAGLLSRNLDR